MCADVIAVCVAAVVSVVYDVVVTVLAGASVAGTGTAFALVGALVMCCGWCSDCEE